MRTYCIAIRVPKGYVEDCMIYDQADPYKYVRFTACDKQDDYLVVGGCDHKVGQEPEDGRFAELEQWVRDRFTRAGTVSSRVNLRRILSLSVFSSITNGLDKSSSPLTLSLS